MSSTSRDSHPPDLRGADRWGCVLGPRCGDGIVQTDQGETCDDGNNVKRDGCSAACKLEQVK
ncbi:MAG: DUF4215 domain-containing protein [Polyangiaceae bacterium]